MANNKVELECQSCGEIRLVNKYYAKKKPNALCRPCSVKKMKERSKTYDYREKLSKAIKKKWEENDYRNKSVKAIQERAKDRNWIEKVTKSNIETYSKAEIKTKHSNIMKKIWNDNNEYANSVRDSLIKRNKTAWQDENYRRKMLSILRSDDNKEKTAKASRKRWKDNEFRQRMTQLLRDESKKIWDDKKFRKRFKAILNTDEYKTKISLTSKRNWADDEYRARIVNAAKCAMTDEAKQRLSDIMKKKWEDEEYKVRMAKTRKNMPKVSSIQITLYSILDDLGVKYYREYNERPNDPECLIGPWPFDCVIPREGKKDLLVECQGDYWHSLPKVIAKASYVANNLSHKCELKYLWEHEFGCKEKIVELLKYWLNIDQQKITKYNFSNVEIRKSPASDYKLLLSKYHYLPNTGRGGITYGAYLGEELIAAAVFSSLIRQNIVINNYHASEVRELSRLCIHPGYRKKNLASWFMSRAIFLLPKDIKAIVSYADTTFNHDGAVYKACNFNFDKEVKPDYWYTSEDGWAMHKKTLYNKAKKMCLKEKEYAEENGYTKVFGFKKLRYLYIR